jgi:PAS domain S-box-containing protein
VPRLGIRAYLIAVVGALVAVPMLVLTAVTAERATEAEVARADRESRARASLLARELDGIITAHTSAVELLAAQIEAAGGLGAARIPELLARHRARARFPFMYVADRSGKSLYMDPPRDATGAPTAGVSYHDRDYYRELMRTGRTAISRVQLGRQSRAPNLQIAAPIRGPGGDLVGFAEGSVDVGDLRAAIARVLDGDRELRVVITDGAARVIADSAGRLPLLAPAAPALLAPAPAPDLTHATRVARDDQGQPVRITTARMGHPLGLAAMVVKRQADVQALAAAARRDAALVAIAALAIALLLVGLGVRWLWQPIRALARMTQAVGRGDLAVAVPRPRALEPRELAELLIAVRDMVADLRDRRADAGALIAELETTNDQLRTMVVGIQHAGNPIEVVDAEGRLSYVNLAWERFTGYSADEAIGRAFLELLSPVGDLPDPALWQRLSSGEPWHGVYASQLRDGRRVDVELDAVPVTRGDGAISHAVVTRIDLSAQRRTEEVLRMNDRLAAVGTLAAGVAHEINNPLTYISANLDLLRELIELASPHLPADDHRTALAALAETDLGVTRVATIVRDLKQLARPDERTSSAIDLNALVAAAVRMAQVDIRHRAAVRCEYEQLPLIAGNEARLSQVLLNLLINAAQACAAAGGHAHEICVRTLRTGPQRVAVEIADTGTGIDPALHERIFDPFFTTKPIGVGTGLGLSICRRIVRELGGEIGVASAPGAGATFRVSLPVQCAAEVPEPPKRAPTAPIATPVTAPRARILIVDDEPRVSRSLARMLRQHDVTVASSATHALEVLDASAGAPFDVVLTDVMMPDLDGLELYQRAIAAHPRYRRAFLFMTGGIVKPHLQDELDALRAPCLYKPFSMPQVLSGIAAVCQAQERRSRPYLAAVGA